MNYLLKCVSIIKKNIIFSLSATGALSLHLFFAWLPLDRLEGFTFPWSKGPLLDDSYIFFKISKDLAGWFSGILPSLHLTSGFQPLIALLYTPIFQLFWNNKELPIHCALSLNALLGFFAHIFLYCLLRRIVSRSIAAFLVSIWIWSPYVMNQTINGMETTLALLLLLITLNYYWQINNRPQSKTRSWIFLGILLGIGFWTRVDLGLLGLAIVIDQAWQSLRAGSPLISVRNRHMIFCALTALLVASPWILFTAITTGDIIPMSGKGVHQITSITFNYRDTSHPGFPYMMFVRFIKEFFLYQPFAALFQHISWQCFISVLYLIGLLGALRDRYVRTELRAIWFFQVIILTAYLVFIGGFWHLNRYLYPVYTLMLFIHAVSLRYMESKIRVRRWIFPLLLFFVFIPYAYSYTLQYYAYLAKPQPSRYFSAVQFVRARIPAQVTIGTFQSGALSYWLDNPVTNLDGVINREAYMHVKEKTLGTYLGEQDIEYLVEEIYLFRMWNRYLKGQLSNNYSLVTAKPGRGWYQIGIFKSKPR
jgi:hypothetical protein